MEKEIDRVFNTLTKNLHKWVNETVKILDDATNLMTASVSWDLVNRQLQTKIDEWYLLVDKADIEVKQILSRNGLDKIPPIVENNIRQKYKRELDKLQRECKDLLAKYKKVVASNLDDEIVDEFLTIAQGVTIDNLINIIKQ